MAELSDIRDELADHERRITAAEKLLAQPPSEHRFWWPSLTKDEASDLWDRVMHFADVLVKREYLPEGELIPCWYLHPRMLDKMTAIYANWYGSYSKDGPYYGPIDFQRKIDDDIRILEAMNRQNKERRQRGPEDKTPRQCRDGWCRMRPEDDHFPAESVAKLLIVGTSMTLRR